LKDIIINFLAGVMILAQKYFTIGDFINIEGTIGKIVEIQTRATILQALDGTMVVVPNSELFSKQVISYTSNPFRRIELAVGVGYDTDLNQAVENCYSAIKSTSGILVEPKPVVIVKGFGDSSIDLAVRAWVESRGGWLKIKSNLTMNIKSHFDKADINIPFPIRTVVFDKDVKENDEKKAEEMMQQQKQPEWVDEKALESKQKEKIDKKKQQKQQQEETVPAPRTSSDQPGTTFLLQNNPQVQEGEEGAA
jgi:small conductance mechanosensitive channel